MTDQFRGMSGAMGGDAYRDFNRHVDEAISLTRNPTYERHWLEAKFWGPTMQLTPEQRKAAYAETQTRIQRLNNRRAGHRRRLFHAVQFVSPVLVAAALYGAVVVGWL